MVINFLKSHFNLYIFLENDESNMDECDKFILSNNSIELSLKKVSNSSCLPKNCVLWI